MFCENCGKEIGEARFCPLCGSVQKSTVIPATSVPIEAAPVSTPAAAPAVTQAQAAASAPAAASIPAAPPAPAAPASPAGVPLPGAIPGNNLGAPTAAVPAGVSGSPTIIVKDEKKKRVPERKYSLRHIVLCLVTAAIMAAAAGVFAGLYFSLLWSLN